MEQESGKVQDQKANGLDWNWQPFLGAREY